MNDKSRHFPAQLEQMCVLYSRKPRSMNYSRNDKWANNNEPAGVAHHLSESNFKTNASYHFACWQTQRPHGIDNKTGTVCKTWYWYAFA